MHFVPGSRSSQQKDVAANNADIVKRLRNHYERWWSEVEPLLADPVPVIIGADQENPVTLSSADWWNVYCDNMNDLRRGKEINSNWTLQAAKDGNYEFALRRWPKEADAAITAGVPVFKAVDGELPAGVALPISTMRLKVGEFLDQTKPGRRRFCSPDLCGNRAKVAAFRSRQRNAVS